MTGPAAMPSATTFADSVRLEPSEVTRNLMDVLGAKLVAYIGSVRETRAVRQWSEGTRTPSADVVQRLRVALHVATLIRERETASTAQAWFQGMNPELDDIAPARLLREADLNDHGPRIIAAARSFIQHG